MKKPIEKLFLKPRKAKHDIRQPVLLNADEFVFVRDHALSIGTSISGYIRNLINDDRRRLAQKQLCATEEYKRSANHAHDMDTFLDQLALMVRDRL